MKELPKGDPALPGLLVPGADSEPGPCPGGGHSVSLFYHLFYSILPLPSEGLIFSDEMASPGNAGPGKGMLINPFGLVSWTDIPIQSSQQISLEALGFCPILREARMAHF